MPALYEHRHTVQETEIDDQGHAGNLVYLRWMQEAAVAHSAAQGWSPERYRQEGVSWVVRSHFIEYLQPAFRGEEIAVLTWVANFQKVRSLRKYQIVRPRDEAVLARAETDWAFIDRARQTPCRIPRQLIDSFEVVPQSDRGA